ncbi:uncharacterized protein LOC116160303 isoform X3 [Photinus pyralis]|uniref:uncharacterized protein LOC116160303 isoform X3 n=1 Tax=Photinus pyralis TaxID=7054 RepID=UPI0012670918|nr:uncharacterized protein LOC116160303 isoform X3 [Photinus pyralis]
MDHPDWRNQCDGKGKPTPLDQLSTASNSRGDLEHEEQEVEIEMSDFDSVAETGPIMSGTSRLDPQTPPKTRNLKRRCYFNKEWRKKFSWIKPASSNTDAYCKICCNSFTVSFMGISAVIKHSQTSLHTKKLSAGTRSQLLDKFVR